MRRIFASRAAMGRAAAVLGLALAAGFAAGSEERISPGKRDFCRVVYGCELEAPSGACPDPKALGKTGFQFDSARCAEPRALQARGVGPSHPLVGFRLYRFLGMEYRVIYEVSDTLKMSRPRLEYMLEDLPLAAKLISHYRQEPYAVRYTDEARSHFEGSKGKRLRGEARRISGGYEEKRLFYFGSGTAEVAFWTLKGPALMDFGYWPLGDKPLTGYRMKLLVFPGNGFVNAIMNMGLFRSVVDDKIREVLKDITETARKLQETGGKDLTKSKIQWTPEEKQKIEAFLRLP